MQFLQQLQENEDGILTGASPTAACSAGTSTSAITAWGEFRTNGVSEPITGKHKSYVYADSPRVQAYGRLVWGLWTDPAAAWTVTNCMDV